MRRSIPLALPKHSRVALTATLLLSSTSCIYLGPSVPVHVPSKTLDLSGNERELDFTFLKSAQTTRGEVEKNLAPIDTRSMEPRLFWGRWESSTHASGPLIAPYPPFSGRDWDPQNILITLDPNDVVQGWKVLKDKDLLRELDQIAPTIHHLDLSAPKRLNVELPSQGGGRPSADLVLSASAVEYQAPAMTFRINRSDLGKITSAPEGIYKEEAFHHEPDPSHIWITLHFARRTPLGKSLTCGVNPPEFLMLRHYLRETPGSGTPSEIKPGGVKADGGEKEQ